MVGVNWQSASINPPSNPLKAAPVNGSRVEKAGRGATSGGGGGVVVVLGEAEPVAEIYWCGRRWFWLG